MTAKEFLLQGRGIQRRLWAKRERRNLWQARITGTTKRLSGMPRGGGADWTDVAARIADLDREIVADMARLAQAERDIQAAILQIADARYQELLELRYLNGYSWERIAKRMHYSVRQVQRLHGEALLAVSVSDS